MATEITSTCTTCRFNDGSDWGRGWCARCTNRDNAPCFAPVPLPSETIEPTPQKVARVDAAAIAAANAAVRAGAGGDAADAVWAATWTAAWYAADAARPLEPTPPTVEAPDRDPGWEAVAYYDELCKELAMAEHLYERYNRHGPELRAIMAELDRVQQSFWS